MSVTCKWCKTKQLYNLDCNCAIEKMKEWNQIWIGSTILDQKIIDVTYNILFIYTCCQKNNETFYFVKHPNGFECISEEEYNNPNHDHYYPLELETACNFDLEIVDDTDWCEEGVTITPPLSFREKIPY
jgi:hypothetical protein